MKDNSVLFAIHEFERTLEYINNHPEYAHLKGNVKAEYNRIKEIDKTGNLYDYYKKFRDSDNPHKDEFAFLSTVGIKTSEEMADYIEKNYAAEITNRFELTDFVKGETYTNSFISMIFLCSYQGGMRKSFSDKSVSRKNYDIAEAVCCYPGRLKSGRDKKPRVASITLCTDNMIKLLTKKTYANITCFGNLAYQVVRDAIAKIPGWTGPTPAFAPHPSGRVSNKTLNASY